MRKFLFCVIKKVYFRLTATQSPLADDDLFLIFVFVSGMHRKNLWRPSVKARVILCVLLIKQKYQSLFRKYRRFLNLRRKDGFCEPAVGEDALAIQLKREGAANTRKPSQLPANLIKCLCIVFTSPALLCHGHQNG